MIGYRPGPYIKYCWLFLTPATCIVSINKLIELQQGFPNMTKADRPPFLSSSRKKKEIHPSPIVILVRLSLQGTFAFSLIKYTPLKYNNEYVYPWWGYVIGWLLALSSMVCIPLWMVYKISTTQGTFREVGVDRYCKC